MMKINPKQTTKVIVSGVVSLSCAFSAYHLYQNGLVFNPNALTNKTFNSNQVVFNHQQQSLNQNQKGDQDIYKNKNQSQNEMKDQGDQSGYLFQNAAQPFKSNQTPDYLLKGNGIQGTGTSGEGSTILVPGENGTIVIDGNISGNGSSGEGVHESPNKDNQGSNSSDNTHYVDKDTKYQLPNDPFSDIGYVSAFKPTTKTQGYTFDSNYESVMDMVDLVDPLYYGCVLNPWKLLCNSVVYVLDGDVPVYRIEELSDCFEIIDYPEVVTGDFTATFRFRENVNAPWQEQKHTFKIDYNSRVSLLDYNDQEAGHFYLKNGESENLRKYYNVMISDPSTVTQVFLGWSNKKGGEALPDLYTTQQKGRVELYPLDLVDVPEGFSVELEQKVLNYYYKLTYIDEFSVGDQIVIPDYISTIALEGFSFILVNEDFIIPKSVESIDFGDTMIYVYGDFKVDEDNEKFSSKNGLLMDKDQETVYYMPSHDDIDIPETVSSIKEVYPYVNSLNFEGPLKVKDTSYLSQIEQMFTMINVKDQYYLDYYRYGYNNSYNIFLFGDTLGMQNYQVKNDLILSSDGKEIVGSMANASGTIVIPDTVTKIDDEAFKDNDQIFRLIFSHSNPIEIGNNAFKDSQIQELLFLSDVVPDISKDTFSGVNENIKIEVSKDYYQEYLKQWDYYKNIIEETDSRFYEIKGFDIIEIDDNGQKTTTLLNAPESLKVFDESTLPDIEINVIGKNAFSNCSQLNYVELPSSVERINENAFYGCHNLEGILSNRTELLTIANNGLEVNDSNTGALRFVAFNTPKIQLEDDYQPKCNLLMYAPSDNEGYPSTIAVDFSQYYYVDQQGGGYILYGNHLNLDGAVYLYSATTSVQGHVSTLDNTVEIISNAFENVPITQIDLNMYPFGYFIDNNAFMNTKLSGTLVLPDGLAQVFFGAFANTQIEKVVFPEEYSILWNPAIHTGAFYQTNTLKEVVFNSGQMINLYVDSPNIPFTFNSEMSQDQIRISLEGQAAGYEATYIESWKYLFAGIQEGDEFFYPDAIDKLNEAITTLETMFNYKTESFDQETSQPVIQTPSSDDESGKVETQPENQQEDPSVNTEIENNEEEIQ